MRANCSDRRALGLPPAALFSSSLMRYESVQQQFAAAVDDLVEQIKEDRSVIAAVLCGSLSHDTVWAKSDVDLVLITVDEKKIEEGGRSLYAAGVNVHAILLPRTEFRKAAEGS